MLRRLKLIGGRDIGLEKTEKEEVENTRKPDGVNKVNGKKIRGGVR